ncbi:hypothetical protein PPL_01527 [Heterostelium album PN500]|uniref:Uncharacterized protein n=1 Tax=Heterostelium pallidum (strain ATCC 26659 / Pp 5 / PN500) TaxID=670386 RepID=D3AZR4_HETP5|nr:hypothetical protein PPL_01527 [Heterostelium album PN500]EFA84538.1 hypothetical protein PPL_01527 [Heterostelium album PN500]|eukprot:XP_020436651.1 hypothetical protein PPL_01527 [Heterostelium album PN500]
MTSAIFLLDSRGKELISRNYRGDIQMNVVASKFISSVLTKDDLDRLPIVEHEGISFINVKYNDVYYSKSKSK